LDELLGAIFSNLDLPGLTEVIVVDNDPLGSAGEVLERRHDQRHLLRHFLVPTQNISLARNKAVTEARGTWIAMIDDDERPHRKWLVSLLKCAIRMNADGVFGPVLPRFPEVVPRWIVDGKFFERTRHSTGAVVPVRDMKTGNVLLRADAIRDIPGPFDPDFGLTGGEDSVFFGRLSADGRQMFWCDSAVVEEFISPNRLNWRWLARRSFRTGQTTAQSFLDPVDEEAPSLATKAVFWARTVFLLLAASVMMVVTAPFGKRVWVKWVRVLSSQAGKICPRSVFTLQEYADSTCSK
jgi:succinoglycan biosynthesis protein ExoM